MPHADTSLLPPGTLSKQQFWDHVYDQLAALLAGQRDWVRRAHPPRSSSSSN
jgi:L-methionine (R)-S-oxide reductase